MAFTVARSTDVQALSAVACATFLQTYAAIIPWRSVAQHNATQNSPAGFQAELDRGHPCWLARMDGTDNPVALAMLSAPDLPVEPVEGDMELKRIYALANVHGQGIGRALLDAVEAHAREVGCKRLLLGVYHENPTITWYERRGFTQVGTRSFTVGQDTFHDLILGKTI